MLKDLQKGGTFLLNSLWKPEEMDAHLPASVKRALAKKEVNFYTIDAWAISEAIGLGSRINMIMQAGFFQADRGHSCRGRNQISERRYRKDI